MELIPRILLWIITFFWGFPKFGTFGSIGISLGFIYVLRLMEGQSFSLISQKQYNTLRLFGESALLAIDSYFGFTYGMEILLFERFADIFTFVYTFAPALCKALYTMYFKSTKQIPHRRLPIYED